MSVREISSPHYIISLCDSGYIDMEYDSVHERFTPHDLAILYPQHTCIARQATPDYHITLIVVSADLYAKMSRLNFSNKRFAYEQVPHFHLTDSQYDDILTYIDTLRRITRLDLKSRCRYVSTTLTSSCLGKRQSRARAREQYHIFSVLRLR